MPQVAAAIAAASLTPSPTITTGPFARAFGDASDLKATEVREELGHGISGVVGGRRVLDGAPAWIRPRCTRHQDVDRWIGEIANRGEPPLAIAVGARIVAVAGLADPLRGGA